MGYLLMVADFVRQPSVCVVKLLVTIENLFDKSFSTNLPQAWSWLQSFLFGTVICEMRL